MSIVTQFQAAEIFDDAPKAGNLTLTLERINLFPATISRCIRPLRFLLRG